LAHSVILAKVQLKGLDRLLGTHRAGLGADWHPHEARHLYVSQCVDAGLTMTEVADAVGHARGSRTTARVYSHRMRDVGGSGAKAAIEARYGT
jgi:site-specific recombinase XerC